MAINANATKLTASNKPANQNKWIPMKTASPLALPFTKLLLPRSTTSASTGNAIIGRVFASNSGRSRRGWRKRGETIFHQRRPTKADPIPLNCPWRESREAQEIVLRSSGSTFYERRTPEHVVKPMKSKPARREKCAEEIPLVRYRFLRSSLHFFLSFVLFVSVIYSVIFRAND